MKKLLQLILALFGKKNKVDLDNDGKIESLSEEIAGVFSQFKRMSDKLDFVNEQLDEVISDEKFAQEVERDQLERIIAEANRRLEESDNRIQRAESDKQSNDKLKSKVAEFVV